MAPGSTAKLLGAKMVLSGHFLDSDSKHSIWRWITSWKYRKRRALIGETKKLPTYNNLWKPSFNERLFPPICHLYVILLGMIVLQNKKTAGLLYTIDQSIVPSLSKQQVVHVISRKNHLQIIRCANCTSCALSICLRSTSCFHEILWICNTDYPVPKTQS